MARRVVLSAFTVFCLIWHCLVSVAGAQEVTFPPRPDFKQLLQKMAEEPPESCGDSRGWDADKRELEADAFEQAASAVTEGLNAPSADGNTAKDRAAAVMRKLEQQSVQLNAAWPAKDRFHFEVLDYAPALVVTMSIRSQANYFVFGIPATDDSGKPHQLWRQLGEGDTGEEVPYVSVEMFPLHRGPSGNPRFLASFVRSGCAGSYGVRYDIEEWDRKSLEYLSQILKQDGAFGLDAEPSAQGPTKENPFPTTGTLQKTGALLALPYCWFTDIDTWDSPSLCAEDKYDLSGDEIRFLGRRFNRPDLVPIAKVLEYAKRHDYPEVLAYSGSAAVARKIMRELDGGYGFDSQLETVQLGAGRERVRAAYSDEPGFVVEKRGDRWLVVSFSSK